MRLKIIHAFYLKSADKLMQPGQYFTTEDKAQIDELQVFAKDGAWEELKSVPVQDAQPANKTVDPSDDITAVPGIGAKLLKKLEDAGVKTKSQLKAAVLDPAKEAQMKDLLGLQFEKVQAHFQAK